MSECFHIGFDYAIAAREVRMVAEVITTKQAEKDRDRLAWDRIIYFDVRQ